MDDRALRQITQASLISIQVLIYMYILYSFTAMDRAKDTTYSNLYLNPSHSIGSGMMIYFLIVIVINILLIILLWKFQETWNWRVMKPILLISSILALPFSILILGLTLSIDKPDIKFFAHWSQEYGAVRIHAFVLTFSIMMGLFLFWLLLSVTGVTTLFENEYLDHRVVIDVTSSPTLVGEDGYTFVGKVELHYDQEGQLYLITSDLSYYRNSGPVNATAVDGILLLDGIAICESTQGSGFASSKALHCNVTQEKLPNQSIDTFSLQFNDGVNITEPIMATNTEIDDIYVHSLFLPSDE